MRSFNAARGPGERCKLPQRVIWCIFGLNMLYLARTSRSIAMLTNKKMPIVPSHFRVRLIHQRKISFSLSLSHSAIGRSKFSPLPICGKVIKSHSEREILSLMMSTRLQV